MIIIKKKQSEMRRIILLNFKKYLILKKKILYLIRNTSKKVFKIISKYLMLKVFKYIY